MNLRDLLCCCSCPSSGLKLRKVQGSQNLEVVSTISGEVPAYVLTSNDEAARHHKEQIYHQLSDPNSICGIIIPILPDGAEIPFPEHSLLVETGQTLQRSVQERLMAYPNDIWDAVLQVLRILALIHRGGYVVPYLDLNEIVLSNELRWKARDVSRALQGEPEISRLDVLFLPPEYQLEQEGQEQADIICWTRPADVFRMCGLLIRIITDDRIMEADGDSIEAKINSVRDQVDGERQGMIDRIQRTDCFAQDPNRRPTAYNLLANLSGGDPVILQNLDRP